MKVGSLILAIAFCGSALAQTEPLMKGSATQSGAEVTFETLLESPTPAFSGRFVGGTVTEPAVLHRYLAYNSLHKFFGYDLQVERQLLGYFYRVTFLPLSISPARVELEDPASWTIVPLTGYPAPQIVHGGDTIALDLFNNPTTGQKIVDYIRIQEIGHNVKPYVIGPGDVLFVNVLHQSDLSRTLVVRQDGNIPVPCGISVKAAGLTTVELADAIVAQLSRCFNHPQVNVQVMKINSALASGNPRDFSPEDGELKIITPRLTLNGKMLAITKDYNDGVSGPVVWFYLPDHGRYILSLVPHRNLGFTKAGEVRGSALTFTVDGETLGFVCGGDIASGFVPYNLYVLHQSAWRPENAASRDMFFMGADESAERLVNNAKYYISGEAHRPGAYPLTAPKTVYQALIEAGGLADFAKSTKIYVLRGQQKFPFNYKEVSQGKNLAQNIPLQNGDVIVIP